MSSRNALTRANYDSIRDRLYDRFHKTGQEIKNDLPNILRFAIEQEAWKNFAHADGTQFENLVEWLQCQWPNGTSLGLGASYAITFEDVLQLTEDAPDVHRVLAENAPKGKPGPQPKNGNGLKSPTTLTLNRNGRTTSKAVLSVRLAQERPKFYKAFMRGDYKSVTAAAVAAGLIKDDVRLRRVKSDIRKMTEAQRREFDVWYAGAFEREHAAAKAG
jgi:hypothetical protein